MALNDACDSAIDAAERPSRPVPSGRVSRRAAFVMAAVCLGVGSVPIAVAGSTAAAAGLALVGCIVAYNLLHVRSSAAVVLMGLCRGLACLTAATVAAGSDQESLLPALAPSAAITLHTLGLSLLARDEMADSLIRSALADPIRLFPLIALAPIPTIAAGHHLASTVAASAAYLVWCSVYLLRPLPTVRVVLALISGFCLLDAALLAALGQPDLSIVAAVCFLLTRLGHQRSSGT